jgi:DNA polymerase-3 subunit gamma/tau
VTQVLARKWRPRTFSELVGQEHVVRALTNALRQQRLHHAYLFTGTRGVGKTTIARIMAKALNCETGVTDAPCGKCGTCLAIDAGRFVDLVELDAASNTQVDNMRELLENAMYAPTTGRYKVYIIDEVHMLSRNAFNAMLKTLEEPPAHVKFVLATTDPQKIPVTVLSRCLQFNLKQIPEHQIRGRLDYVLGVEGHSHEPGALELLARAAQGSLRDSLSLLDQAIAHGGGSVGLESTRSMLGAVDQSYLFTILKALAAGDGAALMAEADRMSERSLSFEMALQDMGTLLHRAALLQVVPDTIAADDPDRAALAEIAGLFAADEMQLYYQIVLQGRHELGLAPDEYAGFTMTLLRMLAFAPAAAEAAGQRGPTAAPAAAGPRAPRAAAPVSGPAPASAAAAPAESKKNTEGLSWPALIEQSGLTGMARMLAQHCELVSRDGAKVELAIAKTHEHLLDKPYQEKVRGALQQLLGQGVKVMFTVGETSGMSPVAIADRDRQHRQAQAIAEIEKDPFVRELVDNFDARVNESTIKPIQ